MRNASNEQVVRQNIIVNVSKRLKSLLYSLASKLFAL